MSAIVTQLIIALAPFAAELGKDTIIALVKLAIYLHEMGAKRPSFLVTFRMAQEFADSKYDPDGKTPLAGVEKAKIVVAKMIESLVQVGGDFDKAVLMTLNDLIHLSSTQQAAAAAGDVLAQALQKDLDEAIAKWLASRK